MKTPDANLVIYAYIDTSPQHQAARQWLEEAFSSGEEVGIPMQVISAFLRITTHRRLLLGRYTMVQAIAIVDGWLALPNVSLLLPSDRHWRFLKMVLLESNVTGDQVTDAQIAAIAQEHGATVFTNDRDFAKFPGVRWRNPLITH